MMELEDDFCIERNAFRESRKERRGAVAARNGKYMLNLHYIYSTKTMMYQLFSIPYFHILEDVILLLFENVHRMARRLFGQFL
jgi:hypothetical protein